MVQLRYRSAVDASRAERADYCAVLSPVGTNVCGAGRGGGGGGGGQKQRGGEPRIFFFFYL
jgi:hypothetical protein